MENHTNSLTSQPKMMFKNVKTSLTQSYVSQLMNSTPTLNIMYPATP